MQTYARALLCLCLCSSTLAQTSAPPPKPAASSDQPASTAPVESASPLGHWIADHPPGDGLLLSWDFRRDKSVTVTAGVFSHQKYTLDGPTLTITSLDSTQTIGQMDIHFADGKLYTVAHADHPPTIEFTRLGPQADPESPIVGTWKVSNAPHTSDPEQEKVRDRMMNMIVNYSADGSYETRLPLKPVEGTWDAAAGTYTLKDFTPLHFERSGDDLKIALPPEGKEIQLYHRDAVLDQQP